MKSYIDITEEMMSELKSRSRVFVEDNIVNPTPMDYLIIENAFLLGASIAFEKAK
jgi:hypothetical protein